MRLARTAAWQAMVASSSFCREESTWRAPNSRISRSRSRARPATSPPASSAGAARTDSSFGPDDADLEAEPLERLAVLLGGGDVQRLGAQHRRHQQALALHRAGVEVRLQLLHHDALVRGVHVDQHQAGLVLRQDVDAVQLRERVAQRMLPVGCPTVLHAASRTRTT